MGVHASAQNVHAGRPPESRTILLASVSAEITERRYFPSRFRRRNANTNLVDTVPISVDYQETASYVARGSGIEKGEKARGEGDIRLLNRTWLAPIERRIETLGARIKVSIDRNDGNYPASDRNYGIKWKRQGQAGVISI